MYERRKSGLSRHLSCLGEHVRSPAFGQSGKTGDRFYSEPDGTTLCFEVSATVTRLRRHIEAGDARLIELFEEARRVRERWAKQ